VEAKIAWYVSFSWITGIVFGFEHITGEEGSDDGIIWMIVLHLPFFRICFGQCFLGLEEVEE